MSPGTAGRRAVSRRHAKKGNAARTGLGHDQPRARPRASQSARRRGAISAAKRSRKPSGRSPGCGRRGGGSRARRYRSDPLRRPRRGRRADEARGGLLVARARRPGAPARADPRRPAWPRRAAPGRPEAAVGDGGRRESTSYESLISIMRSKSQRGHGRPPRAPASAFGSRRSEYSSRGLPEVGDQTALGAREARALGPAGGDPDGDRLRRQVVDRGAAGAIPAALEVHLLARPQLMDQRDGLAQPLEPLARSGPIDARRGDLVHGLARSRGRGRCARSQAPERGEGLCDDGRVVAVRGRQDAGADQHARRSCGQRAEPGQRGRRVPAIVPEGLEVIRDGDTVEPEALGRDPEREQLGRSELLGGRLVAQAQWREWRGRRHRLGFDGSPFPWRVAGTRAREVAAARQVAPVRRARRRRPQRSRAVPAAAGGGRLPGGRAPRVRGLRRPGGACGRALAGRRSARRRRPRPRRQRGAGTRAPRAAEGVVVLAADLRTSRPPTCAS